MEAKLEQQRAGTLIERINGNKAKVEEAERKMQTEFSNERFQSILYFVQFDYQNPYPSFNRAQVFGKFSTLFTVKEPDKYCMGLQQAAVNKLMNVVVTE